jgi:AbrB family looped-hinge helix DNA binding protein
MNQSCDAIVNKRGMITIPKAVREKFGLKEGSKISFVVVDGVLEVVPYRSIEEMEAACKNTKEEMERIQDEDRESELRLENE